MNGIEPRSQVDFTMQKYNLDSSCKKTLRRQVCSKIAKEILDKAEVALNEGYSIVGAINKGKQVIDAHYCSIDKEIAYDLIENFFNKAYHKLLSAQTILAIMLKKAEEEFASASILVRTETGIKIYC